MPLGERTSKDCTLELIHKEKTRYVTIKTQILDRSLALGNDLGLPESKHYKQLQVLCVAVSFHTGSKVRRDAIYTGSLALGTDLYLPDPTQYMIGSICSVSADVEPLIDPQPKDEKEINALRSWKDIC
ncbi:hypothetical protein Tco_0347751 [Tanacetum coccineum]